MENASKALLIVASIVTAVLILAVGLYIFSIFSERAYENEQERMKQVLVMENSKFTRYEEKSLNSHDYITIENMVVEYNKNNLSYPISLNGKELTTVSDKNRVNRLEESDDIVYEMKITEYYPNGKIMKIEVNKK